jgi:hypothetical protein
MAGRAFAAPRGAGSPSSEPVTGKHLPALAVRWLFPFGARWRHRALTLTCFLFLTWTVWSICRCALAHH